MRARADWIAAAAVSLALVLAGCGKDAEVEAFLALFASTAAEIERAHGAAGAGGAEAAAAQAFARRRDELRRRYERIKDVRGFQLREETKRRFGAALAADMERVCGLGSARLCEDFKGVVR